MLCRSRVRGEVHGDNQHVPAPGREKESAKIDQLMDRASKHLVARRYFDAEQECAEALTKALTALDYERMARILLPLQEARRQKRDQAFDAGEVFVVEGDLPAPQALRPGCYLVRPPRVGVDGRMLREEADRKKVPIIVAVREPTTRDGLWPVVAVGPVTLRTRVAPPTAQPLKAGRRKASSASPEGESVPDRAWFITTNELLGDSGIAEVGANLPLETRVQALYDRLAALPDHEKLHQHLAEACREAAKAKLTRKPTRAIPAESAESDDDGEESV